MSEYEYNGCMTGFSEGDAVTLWQPEQVPQTVECEHSEYTQRLADIGLLIANDIDNNFCRPEPSQWSEPISWDMLNHPNTAGYVSVCFDASGSPNFGVNLNEVQSALQFFRALATEIRAYYGLDIEGMDGDSVKIRLVPISTNIIELHEPVVNEIAQRGSFHMYDEYNIENMAYSTICLADAFEQTPIITQCMLPDNNSDNWELPLPTLPPLG